MANGDGQVKRESSVNGAEGEVRQELEKMAVDGGPVTGEAMQVDLTAATTTTDTVT